MTGKLYKLRIELDEIAPSIWRRFVVPADIPLDRLHDVIQIVMGWRDHHLHQFAIDGKTYTEFLDGMIDEFEEANEDESLFRFSDFVKRKGTEFSYVYDFGDDWRHTLLLERTNFQPGRDDEPIMCLEGAGNCPPEDVGGVPGYDEFRRVMADPTDPEHDESKTWYGKAFDPQVFDRDKVNLDLLSYMRWSRPRAIDWDPRGYE